MGNYKKSDKKNQKIKSLRSNPTFTLENAFGFFFLLEEDFKTILS